MLCKYQRLAYNIVFTFSIAFCWLLCSDELKHMQINSMKDSESNSFNSKVMWKWIKSRNFTNDIFFHDEFVSSTSILKHMNANDSKDSIIETDVMIIITSSSLIDDLSNQLKRSNSDEDNDEKNWDQWLVFCSLTWII